MEPLIAARKRAWKMYLRSKNDELWQQHKEAKRNARHQMQSVKSGHFDSLLADYEKLTEARHQSNAAKRIADDEALRNFYSGQIELQKEPGNTQVQTGMHKDPNNRIPGKALMRRKTSLNSPVTSSTNTWPSSVYTRHRVQMEYAPN